MLLFQAWPRTVRVSVKADRSFHSSLFLRSLLLLSPSAFLKMGPVRIRHSSHDFGWQFILWISLGGKPKWLPLKFVYHDLMHTSPIEAYFFRFSVFFSQLSGNYSGHLCASTYRSRSHTEDSIGLLWHLPVSLAGGCTWVSGT